MTTLYNNKLQTLFKYKMNRQSTNNNNNSRFNFVNNELQKDKTKTNDKKKETNVIPKENMFKQRDTNTRFNIDRLMEEPVATKQNNDYPPPPPNPSRNYSFVAASKAQQVKPIVPQIIQINQNDFPTLAAPKNLKSQAEPAKINFKNAVNTANNVVIEEKKFVPKPGMAYIIKNKAGKSVLIHGPKTVEEKRNEYQEKSLNYQMYLAISRMEARWAEEKQQYNIIHGDNAYQSKYGNTSNNNSEDEYNTDTDTNEDDSEYETE